ncbi:hypothetical protein CPB97_003939 [Podila verticillata]|nr:hypothetical protein CPB97_003939 [Podila verticillata]
MSTTCDIDPKLLEKIEAFRFSKRSQGSSVIVCKINKDKLLIEMDSEEDAIGLEELAEELPESIPRYIILSYELKHDDGRVSFPLVFLFYCPVGANNQMRMLYASAKTFFQNSTKVGKDFEIHDAETLTDDWLRPKLLK